MKIQEQDPLTRVIVYGTLKRRGALHVYLQDAPFLGTMWVKDHVMMHLGHFPAITEFDGHDSLAEVYQVPMSKIIHELDSVEGVDQDFYRRKEIATPWGPGMVYYQPGRNLRRGTKIVVNGIWLGPNSLSEPWLGDTAEEGFVNYQPTCSRRLSLAYPSGDVPSNVLDSLWRRFVSPYHTAGVPALPAPPVPPVYTPPPPPIHYPTIDIKVGPGFEDAA